MVKLKDGSHNGYCVKNSNLNAPARSAEQVSKVVECSVLGFHSLSTFARQKTWYCTRCCPYDGKRATKYEKDRLRKEEERRGEKMG